MRRTPVYLAEANAQLLRQAAPPAGFGHLPAATAATLIAAASLPRPPRRVGRCAVVGSAANLLGSHLGRCIDSHDVVIRFNGAADAAAGAAAAHLGHRTTWQLSTYPAWRAATQRASVGIHHEPQPLQQLLYCQNTYVGVCQLKAHRPIAVNPSFVGATSKLMDSVLRARGWDWLHRQDAHRKPPSTGMVGIGLALASCRHVDVFGFTVDKRLLFPPSNRSGSMGSGGQGGALAALTCAKHTAVRPGCVSARDYFGRQGGFHAWQLQFEVVRALAETGQIRLWA